MDASSLKVNDVMTIYVEIVAKQEDFGGYVTYVFKDLNKPNSHVDAYKMVTRLPNWNLTSLSVGDRGYLDYVERVAGVDKWYDKANNIHVYFAYDGVYINKFVHEKEKVADITL